MTITSTVSFFDKPKEKEKKKERNSDSLRFSFSSNKKKKNDRWPVQEKIFFLSFSCRGARDTSDFSSQLSNMRPTIIIFSIDRFSFDLLLFALFLYVKTAKNERTSTINTFLFQKKFFDTERVTLTFSRSPKLFYFFNQTEKNDFHFHLKFFFKRKFQHFLFHRTKFSSSWEIFLSTNRIQLTEGKSIVETKTFSSLTDFLSLIVLLRQFHRQIFQKTAESFSIDSLRYFIFLLCFRHVFRFCRRSWFDFRRWISFWNDQSLPLAVAVDEFNAAAAENKSSIQWIDEHINWPFLFSANCSRICAKVRVFCGKQVDVGFTNVSEFPWSFDASELVKRFVFIIVIDLSRSICSGIFMDFIFDWKTIYFSTSWIQ